MITRKDDLLVRPFQQKKYAEHRKKVVQALPRIDDITPPLRSHIYYKCKKLQTEAERHAKIERENFILLKHLDDIMTAKRIDNCWLYEHPRFLCRIKLFQEKRENMPNEKKIIPKTENSNIKKTRTKERCIACNPEKFSHVKIIPEERIPWESKSVRKSNAYDVQKRKEDFRKNESPNYKSESKTECLLKHRSQSAANISHSMDNRKNLKYYEKHMFQQKERPLTVVMRFPSMVHVTFNATLKDNL